MASRNVDDKPEKDSGRSVPVAPEHVGPDSSNSGLGVASAHTERTTPAKDQDQRVKTGFFLCECPSWVPDGYVHDAACPAADPRQKGDEWDGLTLEQWGYVLNLQSQIAALQAALDAQARELDSCGLVLDEMNQRNIELTQEVERLRQENASYRQDWLGSEETAAREVHKRGQLEANLAAAQARIRVLEARE
jgi:hypothetical protein